MQSPLQAPTAATDPKSVKVNLTTGTGVDIQWADGHVSHYDFVYLRDACPCAMCNEERDKARRKPGEPAKLAPGALPMFKPAAKPVSAEGMGKYAIRFKWNDDHDLGIYSWKLLRELCPCEECKAALAGAEYRIECADARGEIQQNGATGGDSAGRASTAGPAPGA